MDTVGLLLRAIWKGLLNSSSIDDVDNVDASTDASSATSSFEQCRRQKFMKETSANRCLFCKQSAFSPRAVYVDWTCACKVLFGRATTSYYSLVSWGRGPLLLQAGPAVLIHCLCKAP